MTSKLWLLPISLILIFYGSTHLRDDIQRSTKRTKVHHKAHLKPKKVSNYKTAMDRKPIKDKITEEPTGNLLAEEQEIMQQVKLRNEMHLSMSEE